ncbi:restriction endonuclease subunit S [Vibrio hyugaensis]|uniref:restriction endonuclease subunit S n=1 Tax=Vibrio hyugaensis TaxID=1534743 RepID=UPI000CE55C07|nr:restriction endonuclease subunit S [Vibrio hyugaensis]
MTEQMNVPKLRFGEFDGCWKNSSMKEISKINQGLQIPISERYTELKEGRYFYITNEFLRPNSTTKYYIENPSDRVVCEARDILMTRTGNTGQVVTNIAGVFHNNFFKIDYTDDVDKHFLVEFLRLPITQSTILRYAGASTIPDLNHGDFYRIKLALPTLSEQQKIASFLSKVDEKITLLTEKKAKLTEYKKGVMQQLFDGKWQEQDGKLVFVPPTLRFKSDDGSEFLDWEEKRFDDIFNFSSGKNIKQNEASPDFTTPCVRYGELYHLYGEVITTVVNHTNLKSSELTFSEGNEILLPSAGEDPLDIGAASALTLKGVAIGRTINVLRPKTKDSYSHIYVSYYINNKLKKKISTLARGASISNVYNSDLKGLSIPLPSLKEQQVVESFLLALEKKLALINLELDKVKEWKKGLLQQMFV